MFRQNRALGGKTPYEVLQQPVWKRRGKKYYWEN
jgi:hypothetical protein